MIVSELIKLLEAMPQDAKVVIPHEWDFQQRYPVSSVQAEKAAIYENGTIMVEQEESLVQIVLLS